MSKIAIICDTHFGVRSDNVHFHDYFSKFFKDVFFPYIDENDIKHIIHLGDVTDKRKQINFLTASVLHEQFIKPIMDRNIELHVTIGNHDTYFKNDNRINSMEVLYGSSKYDKIHSYVETTEINIDGLNILLVPWINKENYDRSISAIENSRAPFCMGHLQIEGAMMQKGIKCEHGITPKIFNNFDSVYSGHFHHPSTLGNIVYLGNFAQFYWDDYDTDKGFSVLDTRTREKTHVKNPYEIFVKYRYDDRNKTLDEMLNDLNTDRFDGTYVKVMVDHKHNLHIFDSFIKEFEKKNVIDLKVIEDIIDLDELRSSDIIDEAEDTLSILKTYTKEVDNSSDRPDVVNFLSDLYKEAIEVR